MLLKQVLVQSDSIPSGLETAYDEWRSRCKVPDNSAFTGQVIAACATFSSAFVVLDALDECSEESLESVIALIRRIKASGVNVFCTSRPHLVNLERQLENPTTVQICAYDDDVRKYLTKKLSKEDVLLVSKK